MLKSINYVNTINEFLSKFKDYEYIDTMYEFDYSCRYFNFKNRKTAKVFYEVFWHMPEVISLEEEKEKELQLLIKKIDNWRKNHILEAQEFVSKILNITDDEKEDIAESWLDCNQPACDDEYTIRKEIGKKYEDKILEIERSLRDEIIKISEIHNIDKYRRFWVSKKGRVGEYTEPRPFDIDKLERLSV